MKAVHPYLNFNGNTEEVFTFYKSVFGGEYTGVMRYKDMNMGDGMGGLPDEDLDKIAHISLPLANGSMLMGSDSLESFGGPVTVGDNVAILLEVDDGQEARRLFNALSDGGTVDMPLERTEWAEKYGMCTDRFDIQWMVNYSGDMAQTSP